MGSDLRLEICMKLGLGSTNFHTNFEAKPNPSVCRRKKIFEIFEIRSKDVFVIFWCKGKENPITQPPMLTSVVCLPICSRSGTAWAPCFRGRKQNF